MRGRIDVFGDPIGQVVAPTGVILAPDGDVWFTSIGNHRVGRVRPSTGTIETFVDPTDQIRLPANIVPGADGRMWFTCLGSGMLASIDPAADDPARSITHHAHPELDGPVAIKSGPDGRLWFTLRRGAGAVGSLDPCVAEPLRTLEVHRSPTIAGPSALFAHRDGSIWWVNAGTGSIGWLHPERAAEGAPGRTGAIGPEELSGSPRAWACDAGGRLWLTMREPAGLLSFDPTSRDPLATVVGMAHDQLVTPDGIWTGADGALWIADTDADRIARYDPAAGQGERWSFFGAPPVVSGPFDIKGNGGDLLWFTNKNGNTLASIDTSP